MMEETTREHGPRLVAWWSTWTVAIVAMSLVMAVWVMGAALPQG
jgi:hypothetical protein